MIIKVAFLMLFAFFLVMLFNQLPDYILGDYSNYLVLVIMAVFGGLVYAVGKMK